MEASDPNKTIQDSRRAAMSFLDSARKKEQARKTRDGQFASGGGSRSGKAVNDFLRAGRRNEERAAAAQAGEETGFDLHDRFSHMSDEEFDRGVADGTITPDQIRKAGQEAYENYMLDVWSETDQAEDMPWPSYEEFMENPEKYGYTGINDDSEYPDRFERYKPSRYQKQ